MRFRIPDAEGAGRGACPSEGCLRCLSSLQQLEEGAAQRQQSWSQGRDCPICPPGWGRTLDFAFLKPGSLVSGVAITRPRTVLGTVVSAAPSLEFIRNLFPASCLSK